MSLRQWRNLDWPLLGLMLLAAAMGLVAVAGVTGTGLHDPVVRATLRHQIAYTIVGLVAFVVCASTDYHAWSRWAKPLYVLLLVLLIVTWRLGHHALGAARWIRVGHFEFQPSEFCKLLLVVCLSTWLAPQVGRLRGWGDIIAPTAVAALPALLVALQPDLGTSLVFAAILVGILFAAGVPGERLVLGVALVLGAGIAAVVAHLRWHVPIPIHAYQLNRLLSFLHPQHNAQSTGYHILQSEMAIGSGRVWGNGLFSMGVNNQLRYLPESNSDFVFASISDVAGFVGAASVLGVLVVSVCRMLRCMASARDAFGALLVAGVAAMLGFQTLLNAGVTLGLTPVTGVPLPFFSVGGSAAVADFLAMGVVQSVCMRRKKIQF